MKTILFTTKEESKKIAQEEFLALSPQQRMTWFLHSLSSAYLANQSDAAKAYRERIEKEKNNFIIVKV